MDRKEALQAMIEGKKITHKYFTSDEYYFMPNHLQMRILAEDGVNHTTKFFGEKFMETGWRLF